MSILVVNAGSSTVKFALFRFDDLEPVARGLLDWAGQSDRALLTLTPLRGEPLRSELEAPDYRSGVVAALKLLGELKSAASRGACPRARGTPIRVVGHRLIHGGEQIRRPVRIDPEMKETIGRYAHLAPLHIPAGLEAIAATESALPGVPQVGLFDTAFFADVPPAAYLYPLPYEWYQQWGIRRYGFHGTSHAYCTGRAAEMLQRDVVSGSHAELRLVICHLGQGASATAVRGGVAVTNSMGFTPLEGLVMGTRCGTVDPGILLYVQREKGLSVDELDEILHHGSGLLGVSGLSSDFRQVEAAARDGHHRAQLALDVYAYRVKTTVGALVAALGGLDALVFTGGIGENSAWLRSEVCEGLQFLGIRLDADRNADCRPDGDVAAAHSAVRVLVIHTREDLMIARESRRLALELQ
jgi:acetate kinase